MRFALQILLSILNIELCYLSNCTYTDIEKQPSSQVLLCANNRPVLNDVTFAELVLILQRASSVSEVLSNALANGKLECLDSGQARITFQSGTVDQKMLLHFYSMIVCLLAYTV